MLLILLISCSIFALILLSKHQNFFKSQNVPYIKSFPLLGVLTDVVLRKKGIYDVICDIYNDPDLKHEKFFGIFLFHKPTIFIKDPELIKRVLIKDFHCFSNRYSSTGNDDEIGAPNLFVVKNPGWKHIRAKFSPFFSSGKLKAAYYIIEEMGSRLVGYIEKRSKNKISEINLKTAMTLYTVDIIGNIAFGLDPQGLLDVFEEFHTATMTIYGKTFKRSLEISTILLLPVLMKVFKTKLLGSTATEFILKWMPKVISDRENSGIRRNDLIDMIIELKKEKEFNDNVMYAQAGSFLGADQNVPYIKSNPFLGSLKDAHLMRKGIYENFTDIYNNPEVKNEPFFGIFLLHKAAIVVKEPELMKRILISDFNSFDNRYSSTSDEDPFGGNLFLTKNPKWRIIRRKISTFFTSGKLKAAYYLVEGMGTKLIKYLDKKLDNNGRGEVDLKLAAGLYTMDVIGSVVVGVDPHSLEGVDDEFQMAVHSIFSTTFMRAIVLSSSLLAPKLVKIFKFNFLGKRFTKFMLDFLPHVIDERKKSGLARNDLIDLIIELQKTKNNEYSDFDLLAQAASFMAAGYETSSSTASFALYELSKHQEIQQRLRDEIKSSLAKHDGKIPYETIAMPSELPYLHQIVNETLRMYAIIPFLDRVCEAKAGYSLEPYSKFKIPYGMPVLIPIYPLGYDEKYFSEPLKFNPDRFEDASSIPSCAHIPFGTGPRSCIGERLGLIEVKMAIVKILREFRVEMNEKTPRKVKLLKEAIVITPDKPLIVDFVKDPLVI